MTTEFIATTDAGAADPEPGSCPLNVSYTAPSAVGRPIRAAPRFPRRDTQQRIWCAILDACEVKALFGQWSHSGPLAIERRPTDRVAQPLVVQDKIANRHRQPLTLPAALAPTSTIALALRSSSPRCLDRIGGGTEFVGCNVGHRRGLASRVRRVPRSSGQLAGCGIGMACCRACLSHRDFAACPRSSLLYRTAGPGIHGLDRLEERQYVLSAFGRPFSEKPMM